MSKNGNVIACGACAVVIDEIGETTTSIDQLMNGVKHLFSRRTNRGYSRRAVASAAR